MMNFILKILFAVIIVGFILYSVMIALRTRIVANTVRTGKSGFVRKLTVLNVVVTILLGTLAILLISTIS